MLQKAFNKLFAFKPPYPSTLNFKYPTFRDYPLRATEIWMEGKKVDDGAENLWRIHDGLYDLTNFIKEHPGGPYWLEITKGTDITEAFESHHLTLKPESMLPNFYVRDAKTVRNSPFTFKNDGFYKTLKRNIRSALKNAPLEAKRAQDKSKLIVDLLLLFYMLSALSAAYFWSYAMGFFAGFFLNFTTIAAHNFFHQKDNFRMYYFDFSLMSFKSWRISHSLSHHLYPNTIKDFEISTVEPFLQYLPQRKSLFFRYLSWFYSPIAYCLVFVLNWAYETTYSVMNKKFSPLQLLPFSVPLVMTFISNQPTIWVAFMFLWIITSGSLIFGIVGLNAAHHHPDLFHDGDAPRSKQDIDWGIHQMDCVMDRDDINGSHLLVLTNFGDHALHHLFPTLDHGVLNYLYPTFRKTCAEFGIEHKVSTQLGLIGGQFRQLSKVVPNAIPPRLFKS